MQKSVLVAIDRLVKHKKYDRVVKRTTKLMVSDCLRRFARTVRMRRYDVHLYRTRVVVGPDTSS